MSGICHRFNKWLASRSAYQNHEIELQHPLVIWR